MQVLEEGAGTFSNSARERAAYLGLSEYQRLISLTIEISKLEKLGW